MRLTQVPSVLLLLVGGEKVHGLSPVTSVAPILRDSGGISYPARNLPLLVLSVPDSAQALQISTDNPLTIFLTFLAEEQVTVRTARAYVGHLQRFADWLGHQYRADLLEQR